MKKIEVKYSKSQIIKAGKVIRNNNCSESDRRDAIKIIDNWRAAHAYPMHVIYMHFRKKVKEYKKAIVAERLKRLDSIIKKLEREPTMSLYNMQDLGGCRFIVETIDDVYKVVNSYKNSRVHHIFVKENDYIGSPKLTGYRSYHMVYKYHSENMQLYNKNMLVEIQVRTYLQHLWATAVEMMGLCTKEAIKSGQGNEDVNRFFLLISALFAIEEKTNIVPNVPMDINSIISEIKKINEKNNYLDLLSGVRVAVKAKEENNDKGYYILILNYERGTLQIKFYKDKDIDKANEEYNAIESSKNKDNIDAVLVQVSSFNELKAAYPNYFSDIGKFIDKVNEFIV